MIVVIPTCRGIELDYLTPLIDHGCRFIVVDDSPGSVRIDHPAFEVYSWPDRTRLLGSREIAVPKGNGACRDLGFYVAWKESDDDEIIIALDDDCRVESDDFIRQTLANLRPGRRPVVSGAGRHFNIFDLYEDPAIRRQFPRGFPYAQRLDYRAWDIGDPVESNVLMNLGLWKGVLDVNAMDRLAAEDRAYPEASLRTPNVVIPPGALISVCSGSMQFRRSVIPAIYQLPMDVPIMRGFTINRFGDIWGGFILKLLMDRRGESLSVGPPLVHHLKIGRADENARKEHLGHLVGDEFIAVLDQASANLQPRGYLDMMAQLREELVRLASGTSPILRVYLHTVGKCLAAWIGALSA